MNIGFVYYTNENNNDYIRIKLQLKFTMGLGASHSSIFSNRGFNINDAYTVSGPLKYCVLSPNGTNARKYSRSSGP